MKKLFATLACAIIASSTAFAGEYADISIKELQSAIDDGKVAIIDVNGSNSYKRGHIPGAVDFAANSKDLAAALPDDKSTLVVAYCGGPSCSAYQKGAKAAEKLGYTNVKHLSAGISGWLQANMTTEKAGKKS